MSFTCLHHSLTVRNYNFLYVRFYEWNLGIIFYTRDTTFDDHDVIKSPSVFQIYGCDLITHSGFGLRNQILRPFFTQYEHV
jgi:hypothetical protein